LPPGDYRLTLDLTFPDSSVSRSAAFHMGGFETDRAMAQVSTAGEHDRYARLGEAELDTLAAPLVQIMDRDERGVYDGLSVEGKRNFLRAFWAKRDPTPGTAVNEAEQSFYQSIQVANRRYREGGAAGIPGWRTDRGRIFIRYGDPDETLKRPQAGPTPPYEVWKYSKQRSKKFVFLDETRFGNYALIYTDEMREPSRSNWMDLLGPEAVLDVQRF
jgi:GWxTD domain-containing protein